MTLTAAVDNHSAGTDTTLAPPVIRVPAPREGSTATPPIFINEQDRRRSEAEQAAIDIAAGR